jgi:transposase
MKKEHSMSKTRRKYDEEFKKRAVELSYHPERTVRSVAEGLGIHPAVLQRWRKKYQASGEKTVEAKTEDEIRQLQRRIAELEEENDILKKASAYFAAQHRKYR